MHNPGLKLAFSAESPNLLRLIKEIEETEEEICPVCKKDTCEDPYVCLKEAKFMVVGDNFQIEPRQREKGTLRSKKKIKRRTTECIT